jgi:hypothetical protein
MTGLIIKTRKIISAGLWPILGAAFFSLSARSQQPQDWGNPVDDVQISIYIMSAVTAPSGLPAVGLAVHNLGSIPKKILLGSWCGPVVPGAKTSSVALIVTDLQGRSRTTQDIPGPRLKPGCFGSIRVFTVDLKPGETTTVPIDLECYYVNVTRSAFNYAWAGGETYLLRAELGNLKSNDLRVLFSKDVPSRRCFENRLVVPCANS